ncbi:MAG: DUF4388 domain-containing protein [Acidobacteriota bacterium]
MEKVRLSGNFSDSPFPNLLYRIWNSKRTGRLDIKKDRSEKNIHFSEGNIIVRASSFDNQKFFVFLQNQNQFPPSDMKNCVKYAKSKKISLLKALTELNVISSLKLWNFLEAFLVDEILPLFDWSEAKYIFDSAQETNHSDTLISVSTIKIIRKGIYQMKNMDRMQSHTPSSEETIHAYPNKSFLLSELHPNERYVFNIIKDKIKINQLCKLCEMGKNEINKIIYLFTILRIAGPPQKTLDSVAQELSKADLHNILESFNKKCSYIFKYISKEIGPVALSVLEKCLKEIKTNLPPQLQNINISPDGKINIDFTPSTHPSLPGEIKLDEFLSALNEILVSELLTIKKTLGDEHESKVAKNLKNTGKWNIKKTKS